MGQRGDGVERGWNLTMVKESSIMGELAVLEIVLECEGQPCKN